TDLPEALRPDWARYLDRIERSCARMETIVSQMLDYTRYGEHEKSPVDLDELAASNAEVLASSLRSAGIDLVLDLGAAGAQVIANDTRLEQLLSNLVENARDAVVAAAPAEPW